MTSQFIAGFLSFSILASFFSLFLMFIGGYAKGSVGKVIFNTGIGILLTIAALVIMGALRALETAGSTFA